MKKKCAKEALKLIQDGMVIGLGGGGTIAALIQCIQESNLNIKIVTPSSVSEKLCFDAGLQLLPLRQVEHVDLAFDGCDEVDVELNALKSGGSIHVREKLIANMADEYILLVDESKMHDKLTFQMPIVVEVLEDATAYVKKMVEAMGGSFTIKSAAGKIGAMMSEHGNLLADVRFSDVEDVKQLNQQLKNIAGVIDTSLVTKEVTGVIVAGKEIRTIKVSQQQ